MGRLRRGCSHRLHGVEGRAMNYIDNNIITIITFLPFAGALLLCIFPRRDRDIRWFALGISLVTLLASLHLPWHYVRGLDGISMWLVVLTTFLTPLCVLISWKSVNSQVKEFFILMLILETAMIGVFVALDLFLLYTMIASVFMLAAIIWLYSHTGSFDFVTIRDAIQSGQVEGFSTAAKWLFLGFFVAFAVKVPLFPLHTWLPDAHVEAPTAGS